MIIEVKNFNEVKSNFKFNETDFNKSEKINENFRFIKPPKQKHLSFNQIKFKNAVELVKEIKFESLDRVFCRVGGRFIFGDFIEAFLVTNNIKSTNFTIETLSLSPENVISLETLLKKGYIEDLHIIISDYFYSHERKKTIQFMYDKLDIDNRFQLSVCRTHCKLAQFKTGGGKHIVIHGSSNLRSSDNLEQFMIEDCEELFNFNNEYHEKIKTKFKTINHGR